MVGNIGKLSGRCRENWLSFRVWAQGFANELNNRATLNLLRHLSGAKIGGFPWRHFNVRAPRRPHTLKVNITAMPLLDLIIPKTVLFCTPILNTL
jgi:hypothetical protein